MDTDVGQNTRPANGQDAANGRAANRFPCGAFDMEKKKNNNDNDKLENN